MSEPVTTTEPTTEPATDPAAQPTVDWEAEAKKWEKRSKENFAKLKEAEPKLTEYEQWRQERQTADERQAEAVTRWQTEAETWRNAAVSSRVETIASADFADPSDAVAAIGDVSRFLDAGGQVDEKAIRTELTQLLERKPHWRKQAETPTGPRPPFPNPAQGTSGTPAASSPRDQFAAILQDR